MLKIYTYNGRRYQFEESEAPAGAVEVIPEKSKAETPENRAKKPANKARKAATK